MRVNDMDRSFQRQLRRVRADPDHPYLRERLLHTSKRQNRRLQGRLVPDWLSDLDHGRKAYRLRALNVLSQVRWTEVWLRVRLFEMCADRSVHVARRAHELLRQYGASGHAQAELLKRFSTPNEFPRRTPVQDFVTAWSVSEDRAVLRRWAERSDFCGNPCAHFFHWAMPHKARMTDLFAIIDSDVDARFRARACEALPRYGLCDEQRESLLELLGTKSPRLRMACLSKLQESLPGSQRFPAVKLFQCLRYRRPLEEHQTLAELVQAWLSRVGRDSDAESFEAWSKEPCRFSPFYLHKNRAIRFLALSQAWQILVKNAPSSKALARNLRT